MSSFIPAYNGNKVNLGLAAVFIGAYNPTTPLALPADTVALGGSWPVGFTAIGATKEGVTLRFARTTNKLYIEEQSTPIRNETETTEVQVMAEFAEDTIETMKTAFGGGTITVTAPATGQPGKSRLIVAQDMDKLTLGLEMKNSFGLPRRILIPLVNSTADVEIINRRAAALRTYKVTFEALCPLSTILFDEITAPALP